MGIEREIQLTKDGELSVIYDEPKVYLGSEE